mmetsp:Transcript_10007/g.18591  ORF Transcript_10007/g.18591 Transcript_10007/m.18591 type:complete len:449 (-) Transcript_10007:108-1454(-)
MHLVHPLREVGAALQGGIYLSSAHALVLGQILGVLPLEKLDALLCVCLATEVAICCSLLVLWLPEGKGLGDGSRAAIELDLQHLGDVVHGQGTLLAAVSLHEQRQRLCHTDGIGKLHQASRAQAAVHHGLGHLSADVGSRAVHFRGVLAREGAAAVRAPATVRVDDDLAASQACIALRAADDELARRVDVQVRVAAIQGDGWLPVLQLDGLQSTLDDLLFNLLVHVLHARGHHLCPFVPCALLRALGLGRLGVLGGDHHGVDLLGLNRAIRMLQVLNGHLRLAVRSQPPALAALAHLRQGLTQARGHGVGQRHAVRGLIAGIPEHDALISRPDIHLVLANVHSAGNVRALLVDAHQDLTALVAQTFAVDAGQVIHKAVKADLGNHPAHDLVVIELGSGGDLAGHHDHVVLCGSLASHLALGVCRQASIQHSIGDLVADLVRVAFVHGL